MNGKIHDFDWAIFNSYVSLPEGMDPSMFPEKTCGLKVAFLGPSRVALGMRGPKDLAPMASNVCARPMGDTQKTSFFLGGSMENHISTGQGENTYHLHLHITFSYRYTFHIHIYIYIIYIQYDKLSTYITYTSHSPM